MHILIVEDERRLAASLQRGLVELGNAVEVAHDGTTGLQRAADEPFDVVVLDVLLPGLSGFEVCRRLRQRGLRTPVLMLTALDATDDKLTGFEAGADDYLLKPFEFRELVARLRALHQRSTSAPPAPVLAPEVLRMADLEMRPAQRVVRRAGQKVELTAKEFDLLAYFLCHPNRVISRQELSQKVWDIHFDTGTNTVDVYVSFLRKKMDRSFTPQLIHTVTGVGYIMREDDPA